jgi:hypothetical protein
MRGRFDNLHRIGRLDPVADHLEIHRLTLTEEFPWDLRMAFNLAFNRSFALPRVARQLVATGVILRAPRKRADDTGIIMYEMLLHGVDSARGRLALRRLNQAHRRFALDNGDSVYVIAALVVVPMRWLQRYGWRRPAYNVPRPPWWARAGLHLTLRARARLLRFARPRETPLFAHGIVTRTYPDGYDLAKVGSSVPSQGCGS